MLYLQLRLETGKVLLKSVATRLKDKAALNKPDRAMMRPDCASACIEFGAKHVACIEREMDEQTDETSDFKRTSQNAFVDP